MHCKCYSHFFSKQFRHIYVSLDVNFNDTLTNDIVSFEQLGLENLPVQGPYQTGCADLTWSSLFEYTAFKALLHDMTLLQYEVQSNLVISNFKRLSERLRDIRISTYQICRNEDKIIRLTTFNKYMCNWTLEVRYILKILWKRGEIAPKDFSSFPQYFLHVVRFSCLSLDQIFTSR